MRNDKGDGTSRQGSERMLLLRRLSLLFTLMAIPVAVVFLDVQPSLLAGCGAYGYGCTSYACMRVEISTDYGYNWQSCSAWIYGPPGTSINLFVRTTLSTTVKQVEGWSFSLKHQGGVPFILNAAELGPGAAGVMLGCPPKLHATEEWSSGYTQGVLIDIDAADGFYKMDEATDLVTSEACYTVTIPEDGCVHQVTLEFSGDVGSPPVANVVSRDGTTIVPTVENLTLNIEPSMSQATVSYCPTLEAPAPCQ